jgi:hypothetical protein
MIIFMGYFALKLSRIRNLCFLVVAILLIKGYTQTPDPNFYIFLAFGQSNMEGYPGVEATDKTGISARYQLLPAVDWSDGSRKKGTWTSAVPPLCRSGTGLCPVDYFGRTLVDSLPEKIKIGVINVSVAGCAIEMFDKSKYQSYVSGQAQWLKDIANGYGGNPYARLVEIAQLAQKDGVIKGFLLHQGESGSTTGQWANEVKTIYNNLITDLSLDAKNIPLIAGDLVNSSSMVKGLPNTLTNSYVASSQGCEQRGDGLHFSAKGYRQLGKNYAAIMIPILKKQIVDVTKDKSAKIAQKSSIEFKVVSPTSISFVVPSRSFVTIKAYDLSGKELYNVVQSEFSAGEHTVRCETNAISQGVVVLKMNAGNCSATRTIYSH